jgi:uracil phosphoribosyltransferase
MACVSNHPVLQHKLTLLRKSSTTTKVFRELLREITFYLGYEATQNLPLKDVTIKTASSSNECLGKKLDAKVLLVPILRSGLGMVEPMTNLLPFAEIYHLGMYRERQSLVPVIYYDNLPRNTNCEIAIILEPMVATANSILAAISLIKSGPNPKQIVLISLVISREGLLVLQEEHPEVIVHAASVSDSVNEDGKLIPGLGDVGDRLFGTGLGSIHKAAASPKNPDFYTHHSNSTTKAQLMEGSENRASKKQKR